MRRVCRGLSRGFRWLALPRACTRSSAFFIWTHSQRETWVCISSTPHGFAYCKSPRGQRVGSPVGQYSSLILRQSMSGTARPFPHRLVSAEIRTQAATHPLGHSLAFPHPDERHVYSVDSFIRSAWQDNTHTKSHALFLAIYHFLTVEGCHLAFTLLLLHVHQSNWLASHC